MGNGSLLETPRLEIRSGSWIQVAGRAGIERGGDDPLVLGGTITVEPWEGVRGYLGISGAIESNTSISLTDSVLEVDGLLSRGGLSLQGDSQDLVAQHVAEVCRRPAPDVVAEVVGAYAERGLADEVQ